MTEQKDQSSTIIPDLDMKLGKVEENIILGLDLEPYIQNITYSNIENELEERTSSKIYDLISKGTHCIPGESEYIKEFTREMYASYSKLGKDITFQIVKDIHNGEHASEVTEIRATYNLLEGHKVNVCLTDYKDSMDSFFSCDVLYDGRPIASASKDNIEGDEHILALNCASKVLTDLMESKFDKKRTEEEKKKDAVIYDVRKTNMYYND